MVSRVYGRGLQGRVALIAPAVENQMCAAMGYRMLYVYAIADRQQPIGLKINWPPPLIRLDTSLRTLYVRLCT